MRNEPKDSGRNEVIMFAALLGLHEYHYNVKVLIDQSRLSTVKNSISAEI